MLIHNSQTLADGQCPKTGIFKKWSEWKLYEPPVPLMIDGLSLFYLHPARGPYASGFVFLISVWEQEFRSSM